MFNLGFPELIFIFLIVLLIFGGKKIPEVARGIGKGIREFKKAKDGLEDELSDKEAAAPGGMPAKTPPPVTSDKPESSAAGKTT